MNINWSFVIIAFIIIIYILKTNQNYIYFDQKCVNLFWTGGYDSTFRLLQLVLIENKCVNPIYLNFDGLDGVNIRRQNVHFEINTMKKIINELRILGYEHFVKPLKIINNIKLSNEVLQSTTKMYKDGFLRRPISQYAYMIQFSLDYNIVIEEGAEKSENGTSYKMLRNYLNKNKMVDLQKIKMKPEFYVIRNLRFPIIHLTKLEMLKIAKKNNFEHIISMSKSCWYPSMSGSPCKKCPMCLDRVIEEHFRS